MSDELAIQPLPEDLERLVVTGDLNTLTTEQRQVYLFWMCNKNGLDPFLQPFEYLTLNGKRVLYAKAGCADQLRKNHKISIRVDDRITNEQYGVFEVWVTATDPDGRSEVEVGAVGIMGLQGESLATAKMKAMTKAKRRATLKMVGIGIPDESEMSDVPGVSMPGQEQRAPGPRRMAPVVPPMPPAVVLGALSEAPGAAVSDKRAPGGGLPPGIKMVDLPQAVDPSAEDLQAAKETNGGGRLPPAVPPVKTVAKSS